MPETSDDHSDNGDGNADVDDERRKPTEILYGYILAIWWNAIQILSQIEGKIWIFLHLKEAKSRLW